MLCVSNVLGEREHEYLSFFKDVQCTRLDKFQSTCLRFSDVRESRSTPVRHKRGGDHDNQSQRAAVLPVSDEPAGGSHDSHMTLT